MSEYFTAGFNDELIKVAVSAKWVWRRIQSKVPSPFKPEYEQRLLESVEGLRGKKGKFLSPRHLKAEKATLQAAVSPLRYQNILVDTMGKARAEKALEKIMDTHLNRAKRHLMPHLS